MTNTTILRRAAAAASTLALLAPLAACAGDDSVAQPATAPVQLAPAADQAEPAVDVAKACAAEFTFGSADNALGK